MGLIAGLVSYVPGTWLASQVLRSMAARQLAPEVTRCWSDRIRRLGDHCGGRGARWFRCSARAGQPDQRGSRPAPRGGLTRATGGAAQARWGPRPAGGAALYWALADFDFSAYQRTSLSLELGLVLMAALALLGPLLVAAAEYLFRLPVRAVSRIGGRLALAESCAGPHVVLTAAVVSVALGVAFVGVVSAIDVTEQHVSASCRDDSSSSPEAVVTAPPLTLP